MQWRWRILLGLYSTIGQITANADTWQEIPQRGRFRLAVPEDLPPFGLIDKSPAKPSYDIDISGYFTGKVRGDYHSITDSPSQAKLIRRSIGIVFQHYNLLPHLTELENVMLAPKLLSN